MFVRQFAYYKLETFDKAHFSVSVKYSGMGQEAREETDYSGWPDAGHNSPCGIV